MTDDEQKALDDEKEVLGDKQEVDDGEEEDLDKLIVHGKRQRKVVDYTSVCRNVLSDCAFTVVLVMSH